jgi:DNA polymerase-3 subunit chi
MPKVNFYLLKDASEDARRLFACRLAEQLQRQGMAVQFAVENEDDVQQLDKLLWSYTPESFLPHARIGDVKAKDVNVLIGTGKQAPQAGTLLNLLNDLPPHHAACTTIAEFIRNDDEAKARSRQQWQRYKQFGYELQLHQL